MSSASGPRPGGEARRSRRCRNSLLRAGNAPRDFPTIRCKIRRPPPGRRSVIDAVMNAPWAGSRLTLIAELRHRLVELGFTDEAIRGAFGLGATADPWSLATGQPARDGSPFSTLATFFWSGAGVEERQLAAALDPLKVSDLEQLGLAESREGRARPLALIRPCDGLFVASDLATDASRVLGVVPAAETLARLTVQDGR